MKELYNIEEEKNRELNTEREKVAKAKAEKALARQLYKKATLNERRRIRALIAEEEEEERVNSFAYEAMLEYLMNLSIGHRRNLEGILPVEVIKNPGEFTGRWPKKKWRRFYRK